MEWPEYNAVRKTFSMALNNAALLRGKSINQKGLKGERKFPVKEGRWKTPTWSWSSRRRTKDGFKSSSKFVFHCVI